VTNSLKARTGFEFEVISEAIAANEPLMGQAST